MGCTERRKNRCNRARRYNDAPHRSQESGEGYRAGHLHEWQYAVHHCSVTRTTSLGRKRGRMKETSIRYPLLTILVTILIILAGCHLISNPTRDEQYATLDELCAIAYMIHYDVRRVDSSAMYA